MKCKCCDKDECVGGEGILEDQGRMEQRSPVSSPGEAHAFDLRPSMGISGKRAPEGQVFLNAHTS